MAKIQVQVVYPTLKGTSYTRFFNRVIYDNGLRKSTQPLLFADDGEPLVDLAGFEVGEFGPILLEAEGDTVSQFSVLVPNLIQEAKQRRAALDFGIGYEGEFVDRQTIEDDGIVELGTPETSIRPVADGTRVDLRFAEPAAVTSDITFVIILGKFVNGEFITDDINNEVLEDVVEDLQSYNIQFKLSRLIYNTKLPFNVSLSRINNVFNSNNRTALVRSTTEELSSFANITMQFADGNTPPYKFVYRIVESTNILFTSEPIALGEQFTIPLDEYVDNEIITYDVRFYFYSDLEDPSVYKSTITLAENESEVGSAWKTFPTASLNRHLTSSIDTYKLDVFANEQTQQTEYSIVYGHYAGSGSAASVDAGSLADSPTRAIYGQWRSILNLPTYISGSFTEEDGVISINGNPVFDFYGIAVARGERYSRLAPNMALTLGDLSGGGNVVLTDDFNTTNRSGSLYSPITSGSVTYGSVHYEKGLIFLDAAALDASASLATTRTNANVFNQQKLYNSIVSGSSFRLLTSKAKTYDIYDIEVDGSEFLYSSNPSFRKYNQVNFFPEYIQSEVTKSLEGKGRLRYEVKTRDGFSNITNPFSYVTTIGLYDGDHNLLAVGKLSKPIYKDQQTAFKISLKVGLE